MKRRKANSKRPEREQLEHDLLKKANELSKKGLGVDL
jgi:putative transposase